MKYKFIKNKIYLQKFIFDNFEKLKINIIKY